MARPSFPHLSTDLREVYHVEDVDPFIDEETLARYEAMLELPEPKPPREPFKLSWPLLRGSLLFTLGMAIIVWQVLTGVSQPELIVVGAAYMGLPSLLRKPPAGREESVEPEYIETGRVYHSETGTDKVWEIATGHWNAGTEYIRRDQKWVQLAPPYKVLI